MKKVITFGTFDVFHIGHVSILERAKSYGDYLIVGVSSDDLNFSKKGCKPIYSEKDRRKIIKSLSCVDEVFSETSLDLKRQYINDFNAEILIMGDDWKGKFDNHKDQCKVIYLPRTPSISTKKIIEVVKSTE